MIQKMKTSTLLILNLIVVVKGLENNLSENVFFD